MAFSSYSYQTTIVGSLIRLASGNRLLKYPDEIHFPDRYTVDTIQREETRLSIQHSRLQQAGGKNFPRVERAQSRPHPERDGPTGGMHEKGAQQAGAVAPGMNAKQMEKIREEPNGNGGQEESRLTPPGTPMDRSALRENSNSADSDTTAIDNSSAPQDQPIFGPNGIPVYHTAEEGGKEDPNLVTWYGPDDPENPLNWPVKYKSWVAFQMALLTFSVYVGSSIYSAGIVGPNPDSVTEVFTVSVTTGLVGLTVFVLGYGIGPMFWAPLSEFPNVGRLPVYVGTLFVFIALQFPTIYANNIHTLLAMRFLAGFFGSPALAVGGATMGDMFPPKHLAYAIGVWGCGAVCGPVLGPLLGGFAYQAKGWTWTIWVLVWLSGACFVLIIFCFPETSGKNILHRRMYRLRKETGHNRFKTQAEIDSADMTPIKIMSMILWRPIVLLFEPTLLVYNVYLALIYGLLYLWFESFPLVFIEVHGFNPGQSGLAFMGIFVGAWLSCFVYCYYIYKVYTPYFEKDGMLPNPEMRLQPAMIAAFCIPIAMFGFGWTGQYEHIHWIVPIIFSSFFGIGAFILFQAIFGYFGDTYYEEIGSVLTLNDLFRASFGAAFPLFAGAMFSKLGIGGGNSLVGGLACLFIPAPFLFVRYGARIRQASKNACNKA